MGESAQTSGCTVEHAQACCALDFFSLDMLSWSRCALAHAGCFSRPSRSAPFAVSSPVDMSVEKVSRVDMFNLITHIGVTSEAARLTLAASGGDVAQALSTELGRMRLR